MGRRVAIATMLLGLSLGAGAQQLAPGAAYAWTKAYVGKHTSDLARDPLFASLVELAVPNLRIRMNRDQALPADVTTQCRASRNKVRWTDGRYLTFSGYRNDGGASQSFFWIDFAEGQVVGAVFVRFEGEPLGQRLILFSTESALPRQVSDLGAAFGPALAEWQRAAHLPEVLPLFYARTPRQQYALRHTAADCSAVNDARAAARCMAADTAAEAIDARAEALAPVQPARAAAAVSEVGSSNGFRDEEAAIQFVVPEGWSNRAWEKGGVRLEAPDHTLTLRVRTVSGSNFAQAAAGIGAMACADAVLPCATADSHSARFGTLDAVEAEGGTQARGMTVPWRAEVIDGKAPVLMIFQGSARGMAVHAGDLSSILASIAPIQ